MIGLKYTPRKGRPYFLHKMPHVGIQRVYSNFTTRYLFGYEVDGTIYWLNGSRWETRPDVELGYKTLREATSGLRLHGIAADIYKVDVTLIGPQGYENYVVTTPVLAARTQLDCTKSENEIRRRFNLVRR